MVGMTDESEHEFEVESRWEAAPAVALVIALQVSLGLLSRTRGWSLSGVPWWFWLVLVLPAAVLFVALAWSAPRRQLDVLGQRRAAALVLLAIISLGNAIALLALITSLVNGHERSGGELLFKGLTIWGTNVMVFGIGFWEIDGGGPTARRVATGAPPEFQFPQLENPTLAAPGWHPRLVDYIYVSFTNSIAFSPTDAMPLSRRAKLLMLAESATSAITVLLVAARAVNILR
jgi:hypothetical protein